MQHRHWFSTHFTTVLIGVLLVGIGTRVWAEDAEKAKPLALRKIMQEMGKSMQAITDGISREDWEVVARMAPLIAHHPQPPLAEKLRILSFVGSEAGKFKGYDEKISQTAQVLEQAAVHGNGQSVISSFATLQNSCLACHQSFRKPFVEHFYDTH
jgi:cytochrome c556